MTDSEYEKLAIEMRLAIRKSIDELRAATAEIAFLRRDLSVKDQYIEYLKRRLTGEPSE